MGKRFFNSFVKITGFPLALLFLRFRCFYEDKDAQGCRIKGPAIIVSNHTSVWDYGIMLFLFFFRTIRVQAAEVLYRKRLLAFFLNRMGAIYVNRQSCDYAFLDQSEDVLKKGGVLCIFPEGRIPKEDETPPLEFTSSFVRIALETGVRIIPVYTDGRYFGKGPASVVIGKPIDASSLLDESKGPKENLDAISGYVREKVMGLKEYIGEKGY